MANLVCSMFWQMLPPSEQGCHRHGARGEGGDALLSLGVPRQDRDTNADQELPFPPNPLQQL